jgi:putative ABC transport system permease protein
LTAIRQDLAYAVRGLTRRPGLAAVALLTLALGIGANVALFSAVDATLLARLPFAEPGGLVLLWLDNTRLDIRTDIASYPIVEDWKDGAPSVAEAAVYRPARVNLTGGSGDPERLRATRVEAGFFPILGVAPARGRGFEAADFTGEGDVAILSHGLWQRRYGGGEEALGTTLEVDGTPLRVVGILPAGAGFPADSELWTPLVMSPEQREARGSFWLYTVARLAPGATVQAAQAELDGVAARIAADDPDYAGYGVWVQPMRDHVAGDLERPLLVLLAAVGFVLLIGCGNVANLLLARLAGRRREVAVRLALGAGRRRLVRQVMTESVLLAAAGGLLGVAVALWGVRALSALAPAGLLPAGGLGIDGRVLAFAVALSLVSGVVVGLLPALHFSRQSAARALSRGRDATGDRAGKRLRGLLIAAEVALALVLLVGAGLLVRSFSRLTAVDVGLDAERVLTADLALTAARYPEPAQATDFYARLCAALEALPGVERAGAASDLLLPELARSATFAIEGRPDPPPEQRLEVPIVAATPHFFAAVGLRLAAGRSFTDADHAEATPVMVINRAMADRFWPGGSPLGQRVKYGDADGEGTWRTVVGVVADARRTRHEQGDRPSTYLPHRQAAFPTMTLAVRAAGEPAGLADALRREVRRFDPSLPLSQVTTLDERLGERLADRRFYALLLGLFSGLALFLALVGVYGVVAYGVACGSREIGVRMALGAGRRAVVGTVLRDGLVPVLAGMAAGLAAAALLTRALSSLLFEVGRFDPSTFVATPAVLLAVAALAAWLPARRAAAVDPSVALRMD